MHSGRLPQRPRDEWNWQPATTCGGLRETIYVCRYVDNASACKTTSLWTHLGRWQAQVVTTDCAAVILFLDKLVCQVEGLRGMT